MSLRQQCLPLPESRKRPASPSENRISPESIDSLKTMDASSYLASVRDQASRMPDVFVASSKSHDSSSSRMNTNVIDGSVASLNYMLSERLKIHSPPSPNHVPRNLSTWVPQTLHNFSVLRGYLHQCHLALKTCERITVPKSKDRYAWHVFCLGREEATGTMNNKYSYSDEEDDHDSDENVVLEIDTSRPSDGFEPDTKLMSQLDDIIIRRVLSHHVYYIKEGFEISYNRGRWIYALLARLQKPLHRDEASLLMQLLRELCIIRKNASGNEESLKIVNTLILIVGIYFEQCSNLDVLMNFIKI